MPVLAPGLSERLQRPEKDGGRSDPEDYPIWGLRARERVPRPACGVCRRCNADDLALVARDGSDTTTIANGLDMKPGDEFLMTDRRSWRRSSRHLRAKHMDVVKTNHLPKPGPMRSAALSL